MPFEYNPDISGSWYDQYRVWETKQAQQAYPSWLANLSPESSNAAKQIAINQYYNNTEAGRGAGNLPNYQDVLNAGAINAQLKVDPASAGMPYDPNMANTSYVDWVNGKPSLTNQRFSNAVSNTGDASGNIIPALTMAGIGLGAFGGLGMLPGMGTASTIPEEASYLSSAEALGENPSVWSGEGLNGLTSGLDIPSDVTPSQMEYLKSSEFSELYPELGEQYPSNFDNSIWDASLGEQYPSNFEGSIYGSKEGLINATGNAEGWLDPKGTWWDKLTAGLSSAAASKKALEAMSILGLAGKMFGGAGGTGTQANTGIRTTGTGTSTQGTTLGQVNNIPASTLDNNVIRYSNMAFDTRNPIMGADIGKNATGIDDILKYMSLGRYV